MVSFSKKKGVSLLFMVKKGEAELEVKSLTLNKPPFKSLASKQAYNTYKILVSPSLRDRVKCGVLDGMGDINSLAIDRYTLGWPEIDKS